MQVQGGTHQEPTLKGDSLIWLVWFPMECVPVKYITIPHCFRIVIKWSAQYRTDTWLTGASKNAIHNIFNNHQDRVPVYVCSQTIAECWLPQCHPQQRKSPVGPTGGRGSLQIWVQGCEQGCQLLLAIPSLHPVCGGMEGGILVTTSLAPSPSIP